MKKQKGGMNTVDDLLKKALKDDLPGEVETNMKQRLNIFREKTATIKQQQVHPPQGFFPRLLNSLEPAMRRLLLKQVLPAFASILLVVMGTLLQMTNGQNVLADSVTTWNASIHTYNQLLYHPSMTCWVNTRTAEKKEIQYRIEWLDAGHSQALVQGPDIDIVKKFKSLENIDDPLFLPVLNLLSPIRLRNLLDGKWMLKEYTQEGACKWGTFDVLDSNNNLKVEITTDLCTCLPVSMKMTVPVSMDIKTKRDFLLNIRFKWNPPVSTSLMNSGGNTGGKLQTN